MTLLRRPRLMRWKIRLRATKWMMPYLSRNRSNCDQAGGVARTTDACCASVRRRIRTSAFERASKIGNLQKPAVADPDSGRVSLGFARRGGVAARLMQFRQSVVRPAVGWRSAERTVELSLRLGAAASMQQGSCKRRPNWIVPVWWLGVGQRVL